MRFWPRSLFGRLALLLLGVLAIALATTFFIFRQDRAALLEKHLGETKIVQIQALRSALEATDPRERRETFARIGRDYGVRIIPETERPHIGRLPGGPQMVELEQRLRESLGPGTEVRIAPNLQLMLVRIEAGGAGYWVGFPMPPRPLGGDPPSRALIWSVVLALGLLAAAFVFARYLGRPLRELNAAVESVGRGESPPPLPENGPSEIENVNRAFNRMLDSLAQLERDRAVLLAGVSHDLRTPLARLRLGIEMDPRDDTMRAGMVDDIEEMDRIIGQFLDFARTNVDAAFERHDPDELIGACVERYVRAGKDVRLARGNHAALPLRPIAFSRLVTNLIDNALAYGKPPVEVSTAQASGGFTLDVADRGPGIPPDEVERLKQPFTRASAARASADGVGGAGLGLAIVERIARLHGGRFDLLPREGGGTVARVTIPLPRA